MPTLDELIEQRARQLAQEIAEQQRASAQILRSGRVFTPFDLADDVAENQKEVVSSPMWSDGLASMVTFYTSSEMSSNQKRYYYEIFPTASDSYGAEAQFSVAYGHRFGSGSDTGGGQVNDSPSRAIYSQFKQLLLEPGDETFTFKNGESSDQIYVVNVNRSRFRERMDPGNWQLNLADLNGDSYSNSVYTGSNVGLAGTNLVLSFIDDSSESGTSVITPSGRVYNVVSGTLADGEYSGESGGYGLFYPDLGVIVFDARKLNASCSFNSVTSSNVNGDNAYKMYVSISGSAAINSSLYGFQARATETVSSTHYFVRIKNAEYNFSNNPSFVTGSNGDFRQLTFVNDPKTYITAVGLYNERYELMAVAKLSQPVLKSFDREVTIKVKLDY